MGGEFKSVKAVNPYKPTLADAKQSTDYRKAIFVCFAIAFAIASWVQFGWLVSYAIQSLHDIRPSQHTSLLRWTAVASGIVSAALSALAARQNKNGSILSWIPGVVGVTPAAIISFGQLNLLFQ